MTDENTAPESSGPPAPEQSTHREGPDVITLVTGMLAIIGAAYALFGDPGALRWVLALSAVVLGVFLLLTSLKRKRA